MPKKLNLTPEEMKERVRAQKRAYRQSAKGLASKKKHNAKRYAEKADEIKRKRREYYQANKARILARRKELREQKKAST